MLSEKVRHRIRQLQAAHLGADERGGVARSPVRDCADVSRAGTPSDFEDRFRSIADRAREAPDDRGFDGQEVTSRVGPFLRIRRPLAELWPESSKYLARATELAAQVSATTPYEDRSIHADIGPFCAALPHRIAVLDIETCGLAGSIIFLVGVLHCHDGEMTMSQHWARSYAEERAMLSAVRDLLATSQVMITFNGKSFDWPQIRDRSTLHERDPDAANNRLIHLDLLHHARRRWRNELPNCKLQTLERYICGRHRTGDIPGRDIPAAYHDYVRTGDTTDVRAILHHNALDLVTLLQLSLLFVPVVV